MSLYPELDVFDSCQLTTADGHSIYMEQAGNPHGIPVLFIHGGPGSGCNPNHRRYFDPERYHIILFDQRGCHRSSPIGELKNNTTAHLLADMEQIREHVGCAKWLLFGGSWGATLALLYAEQYADMVSGLILRGSFLARQRDLEWFAGDGVRRIFPDDWQHYTADIKADTCAELIDYLYAQITCKDLPTQIQAARIWAGWAGRIVSQSLPVEAVLDAEEDLDRLRHSSRIEMHYAKHGYFISENQILANIHRIPNVPGIILHGRRDLTCPLESGWCLSQALPAFQFTIIEEAGHLASEPAMCAALVIATDNMASRI